MDKSQKKMKLMAITLQFLLKETTKEHGEKPHNKEAEDNMKGWEIDRKIEE